MTKVEEDKRMKIDLFMSAINDFVGAKIHEAIGEHDEDSMGAYNEEKHLLYTLEDLLGLEPRT